MICDNSEIETVWGCTNKGLSYMLNTTNNKIVKETVDIQDSYDATLFFLIQHFNNINGTYNDNRHTMAVKLTISINEKDFSSFQNLLINGNSSQNNNGSFLLAIICSFHCECALANIQ